MAKLFTAFDATNVDPTQSTPQLPVGRHPVVIVGSEIKENKEKTGGYLQLDLQIIDGPQKGATGAYRLNLYHNNAQTVEIANRQLSAICHAIAVYKVEDTSALHNKQFVIDVGFQKGQDPETNKEANGYTEVKRVYDMQGNEPGKQGQQSAAQPAQPQAGNGGGWGAQQQQQQPPASGEGSKWGQQSTQQPSSEQAPPANNGQPAWAQRK